MNTAVATTPPMRLPVPSGYDSGKWRILTEVIFPAAQNPNSIMLAVEYCKLRNLDVLKRPVNIVPQWNSKLRRYVDSIWPAISEAHVTAARTHEWAGLDKPVYGDTKTETIKGKYYDGNAWVDGEATVTYPEWCEVTVYRIVMGQRYGFTERVWWRESYGRLSGGVLPNPTWTKRPFGQLAKVGKAASLRAGFPEEEGGSPTAEEMEGQTIDEAHTIDVAPSRPSPMPDGATSGGGGDRPVADPSPGWSPPAPPDHDPETGEVLSEIKPEELVHDVAEDWRDWGARFVARITNAKTLVDVAEWMNLNEKTLADVLEQAPKIHARIISRVGGRRLELEQAGEP